MNVPALNPANAGMQALADMFGGLLEQNNVNLTAQIERLCSRFAEINKTGATAAAVNGAHNHGAGAACALGGKCQGTCSTCSQAPALGAYGDAWNGLVTYMQGRGCGLMCRPLNPCFVTALTWMLTRVSLRRLYDMLERDDESAEINVYAGNDVDFVNINTTALVSNKKTLLAMTGNQMLPLVPAVSKATATWTGTPIVTKVTITLYQGPKGLTGLTLAQLNAQCVMLGQPKNLSKWFCTAPNGQDGTCFVRPWPPFLGCSGSVIPDTEAIYLLVETAELNGATLTGLSFEVIKAGTSDSIKYCKQCEVAVDAYGMPLALGTAWA